MVEKVQIFFMEMILLILQQMEMIQFMEEMEQIQFMVDMEMIL
jgi:hypothetical protein